MDFASAGMPAFLYPHLYVQYIIQHPWAAAAGRQLSGISCVDQVAVNLGLVFTSCQDCMTTLIACVFRIWAGLVWVFGDEVMGFLAQKLCATLHLMSDILLFIPNVCARGITLVRRADSMWYQAALLCQFFLTLYLVYRAVMRTQETVRITTAYNIPRRISLADSLYPEILNQNHNEKKRMSHDGSDFDSESEYAFESEEKQGVSAFFGMVSGTSEKVRKVKGVKKVRLVPSLESCGSGMSFEDSLKLRLHNALNKLETTVQIEDCTQFQVRCCDLESRLEAVSRYVEKHLAGQERIGSIVEAETAARRKREEEERRIRDQAERERKQRADTELYFDRIFGLAFDEAMERQGLPALSPAELVAIRERTEQEQLIVHQRQVAEEYAEWKRIEALKPKPIERNPPPRVFKAPGQRAEEARKAAKEKADLERAQQQGDAARKIQVAFRLVKAKADLKRADAARKIQALWRIAKSRIDLERADAARKIQALWRIAKARIDLEQQDNAARKIQAAFRLANAKRDNAARKIQALYRVAKARMEMKQQDDAARKIQAAFRLVKAMADFKRQDDAARKIQAAFRLVKEKKRPSKKSLQRISIAQQTRMGYRRRFLHKVFRLKGKSKDSNRVRLMRRIGFEVSPAILQVE